MSSDSILQQISGVSDWGNKGAEHTTGLGVRVYRVFMEGKPKRAGGERGGGERTDLKCDSSNGTG